MAVSAKLYGKGIANAYGSTAGGNAPNQDWISDTIKVALATSSYTPDQDVHDFFDDITNEITGTGYTAGGASLANKTVTYTGATNVVKFDADDTSWTTSTLTARYAIVYDTTPGTAGTNPLVLYVDFGADVSTTAGTFTITWDSAGLFTITAA